jgi:hypothetical protein
MEAVHQALLLQAILEAPHQTDHARDKIPGRRALLHAWLEQALIPGFGVINTHIEEVAIDHPPHEGDPASFGEPAYNYYYYRIPVGGLSMDDLPDRSLPQDNDLPTRSVDGVLWHTYDSRLDGDRSWVGEMLVVATEVSASDAELLEMRKTVQQVFDKQEETKEEVVDEEKRDLDGNDDGSGDDNSNDSDDDDSDTLPDTCTIYQGRVWKGVANPRRPKGPEAAGISVKSEHRKGHRSRAAARARSKTPIRKCPAALGRRNHR